MLDPSLPTLMRRCGRSRTAQLAPARKRPLLGRIDGAESLCFDERSESKGSTSGGRDSAGDSCVPPAHSKPCD